MSYWEIYQPYRREVEERYPLVMERIAQICAEETAKEPFRGYFVKAAEFVLLMHRQAEALREGTFLQQSLEQLNAWNERVYGELYPGRYEESYGNPAYAKRALGEEYGGLLCMLYGELRKMTQLAAEQAVYEMTIYAELLVEVYNCFEDPAGTSPEEISHILYGFIHDYSEIFVERNISRMVDAEDDFYTELLQTSDLSDLKYLYRYGCHIGDNEQKMAEFFNRMPQEQIQAMADTYTEGYRIGFAVTGKDLSKKKTVELVYPIGFERMVRAAVANFAKMGLKPVIRRGNGHYGACSVSPNEQYEFDHKLDAAFYLDKEYVERWLECARTSFESRKETAAGYAGPAVIETFGRVPFAPQNKPENPKYNEKQQKLDVYFSSKNGQLMNQYIKGEERSFTIIAYPIPEIGPRFEEIFARTVELNNLDYTLYQQMQQRLIDVLDQAEYVRIRGRGRNRTDLTVAILPLDDPAKQTAFENCVADVNIPVGEVFTSPQLKGTNGRLHVTQVYLNQLNYIDLELEFTDGRITAYRCGNFEEEEKNRDFLKEHLLHHHPTLPLGEFAIGTNTTAYCMAREFAIADKLPILIAEKTGPHFAVGDTCYTWAEDTPVYNPDGKEIVARDNEISILRKEDPQKAYFNCHTDITIPYDELDTITAVTRDGRELAVIAGGRFVVPGTERLNEPLDANNA